MTEYLFQTAVYAATWFTVGYAVCRLEKTPAGKTGHIAPTEEPERRTDVNH